MRKGYPSKLRRSVVGYASAGFADAVKMPRAKARGASLSSGEQVQLMGVKTSATRGFRRSVGTHMKEASLFVKQLVEGKEIRLEFDWENRNTYGRSLAYVYLMDGTFINEEIIKQGYGLTDSKYPSEYIEEFRQYEREARENRRGLWKEMHK